jgi:hypothetical protein
LHAVKSFTDLKVGSAKAWALSLHRPGFVVDSEAEAVRAVTRLGEIDRLQVRVLEA